MWYWKHLRKLELGHVSFLLQTAKFWHMSFLNFRRPWHKRSLFFAIAVFRFPANNCLVPPRSHRWFRGAIRTECMRNTLSVAGYVWYGGGCRRAGASVLCVMCSHSNASIGRPQLRFFWVWYREHRQCRSIQVARPSWPACSREIRRLRLRTHPPKACVSSLLSCPMIPAEKLGLAHGLWLSPFWCCAHSFVRIARNNLPLYFILSARLSTAMEDPWINYYV